MNAALVSSPQIDPVFDSGVVAGLHAVFSRSRQLFGLGIDLVREVLPGQSLTKVPRCGGQVLGVLNLRGEILPVVTIDNWLGLPPGADDPALPIIVLRRADLLVGLRVDAVKSVMGIPLQEIQPHPAADAASCLKGIWHSQGRHPITLLDGPALLEALNQTFATL